MKTRIITAVAVAGLLAALATSDVSAAGRGNGGSKGQSNGTCTSTGTAAATRPVDSQRRDGTFLTTGVTANGSSTRQGKGNGLMDGSRLATPVAPAAPTAP